MKKEYKTWYERVFDGLIEMNSKPKEMEDGKPVTSSEGASETAESRQLPYLQVNGHMLGMQDTIQRPRANTLRDMRPNSQCEAQEE